MKANPQDLGKLQDYLETVAPAGATGAAFEKEGVMPASDSSASLVERVGLRAALRDVLRAGDACPGVPAELREALGRARDTLAEMDALAPASAEHLSFAAVRAANLRRVREVWHHETAWSPLEWLGCALGELGEAAHVLKEYRRLSAEPPAGDGRLADELADTLLYLDLLAARCGIDLALAVRAKFNRVSERAGSAVRL